MHPARLQLLTDYPPRPNKKYILYWMQQSQRTRYNHALEYAIHRANLLNLPAVICFGLTDNYPEANARHYYFLLQGLKDIAANLKKRNILFVVKKGSPENVAAHYAKDAALVVTDRGYLRHQKQWRSDLAQSCNHSQTLLIQVESDAVVPVEVASNKPEYAARTLRPKIRRHLSEFLKPLPKQSPRHSSVHLKIQSDVDPTNPDATLKNLKIDHTIKPVPHFFTGGENAAQSRLTAFIKSHLKSYATDRNEPANNATSHLSPYLHFGQISPLEIALKIKAATKNAEVFLEELIVRRELSFNFCHFTENYDSYEALPAWARKTLLDHAADPRPILYTRDQLQSARTHDPYWNAAQTEMSQTGYMHNYMRMYWAKKILEWSNTPQEAFITTQHLNNSLFVDGRDPNAYASIAWTYGQHDRPWGPQRKIFGTVRYMNAAGLKRKFDMEAYITRINSLTTTNSSNPRPSKTR